MPVPLNELTAAVQSAVDQVLAKHGAAVSVDKLWIGFVAPDNLANIANAEKVAAQLGKVAGVAVHPSVASISKTAPAEKAEAEAIARPGHIIGLVFQKK